MINNRQSVHNIIQTVTERLDHLEKGTVLDSETKQVARKALDELSKMTITSPQDKVELIALASRISILSPEEPSANKAMYKTMRSAARQFFGMKDLSLSQKFLDKVHLDPVLAAEVSKALENHTPLDRTTILERVAAHLGNDSTGPKIALASSSRVSDSFDSSRAISVEKGGAIEPIVAVPAGERDIAPNAAARLIKEGMGEYEVEDISKIVAAIPEKERDGVVNMVAYFIKDGMEEYIGSILEVVSKIPAEERGSVVNAAARFIKEGMGGADVMNILEAVSNFPEAERGTTLNTVALFIKERMNGNDVLDILRVVSSMPAEERDSVVNAAARLIKEGMDGPDVMKILEAVSRMPAEERESVVSAAGPLIEEGMSVDDVFGLLEIMGRICAKKDFLQVFKPLMNSPNDVSVVDELSSMVITKFSSKEEFCEALTQKLTNLVSTATLSSQDRREALKMAKAVLYHQKFLKVTDEHPLIKAAIGTILWLEGDKSDADYVHAHMKTVRSECKTPLEQMIEPVNIVLSEPKGKVAVTLNLQGLQEALAGLQKKGKDFLGLKTWIGEVNQEKKPTDPPLGPKIFVDLFRNLKDRLDREILANPANSAALKEMKANASRVENNLTHPGFLTALLMSAPFGADEAPVPKLTEKLYAIGAALLKEDNTPPQEGGLSPREEMMMSSLLMIEQCAEGQEGGITACYNGLKASQKIPGKIEEGNIHPGVEKTKEYLASELQKVMGEVLEAPKTLRQLGVTETGAFNQGVHQSKYLKNMLGEECGLNHTISKDLHGGLVSRSLMAHSRETIVGVFFQELSQNLVSSLKRDFNSLAKEPRVKLYNDLTDFFTQHKVNLERAWSIESGDVELTEFGALALLEKGGCLLPLSGEYKQYLDLEDKLVAAEEDLRQLQGVKLVDPKALAEANEEVKAAKLSKEASERTLTRAIRIKDPTVTQAKEAFKGATAKVETAEKKLEGLLAQEKLSKAASSKISLSTRVIELIKEQISSSKSRLGEEAAIPEVRPPIPVVQDSLIQGNLPADIQDLETKWKMAESSLTNRRGLLLSCEGELSKATEEDVKANGLQERVDRLNEEIFHLSKEVKTLEEVFLKAREEYLSI